MNLLDLIKLERPLIIFDCETTGPNPRTDRIVELGFILLKPDGSVREWGNYVNPGVPIPHEATYGNEAKGYPGHGITDEMVKDAPSFQTLAPNLLRGFAPGTDYAGFNVMRYDLPLMKAEFERYGHAWSYDDARVLDGFRLWQIGERRTLSDAVERFLRRKHEGAHRAIDDVRASLEVIVAQLVEFEELPRDVAALQELQYPRDPNEVPGTKNQVLWQDDAAREGQQVLVMNFGKNWRGKRLDLMARRDLEWIVSKACAGATAATKVICQNALNGHFPTRAKEKAANES